MKVTRGVILTAVWLVAGCSFDGVKPGPTERLHQVVELDKTERTRVSLRMGGGELEVKGGAAALLESDFSYNVPQWKPSVTYRASGSQGDLEVSQDTQTRAAGESENHWQLTLNDMMPMDIEAHVGAGEARLTLGSLNLRSVAVEMGAGEVDVDLRGQPRASYKVSVHGGVGSATIHVPASVPIAASASGGIGSISVEGLEKQGDRWINAKVPSGPVTIGLDVQGGVGEIRIVAE